LAYVRGLLYFSLFILALRKAKGRENLWTLKVKCPAYYVRVSAYKKIAKRNIKKEWELKRNE
jgi:hypothetical protein